MFFSWALSHILSPVCIWHDGWITRSFQYCTQHYKSQKNYIYILVFLFATDLFCSYCCRVESVLWSERLMVYCSLLEKWWSIGLTPCLFLAHYLTRTSNCFGKISWQMIKSNATKKSWLKIAKICLETKVLAACSFNSSMNKDLTKDYASLKIQDNFINPLWKLHSLP